MKNFYDHKNAQWDIWKAYYCNDTYRSNFVVFDTGEIICNTGHFNHTERKHYGDQNVAVLEHTDDKFPKITTPDGEIVKNTWLGGAGRGFVIDYDTKCVHEVDTRLGHYWNAKNPNSVEWMVNRVPQRFWGRATLYWPYAGAVAIGKPSKYVRPRKLTDDERSHLYGIRAAMKAELMMRDQDNYARPIPLGKHEISAIPIAKLMEIRWETMTPLDKYTMKEKGVLMPTEECTAPMFKIAPTLPTPIEEQGYARI